MKVLDTNILVRLVTKDDPEQTARAAALLQLGDTIWISRVALLELAWVLSSTRSYGLSRRQVSEALHVIVSLDCAEVEDEEGVRRALGYHRRGMDIGDAFLLAFAPEGSEVVTFDERFRQLASEEGGAAPVVAPASVEG